MKLFSDIFTDNIVLDMLKVPVDWLSVWLIDWFFSLIIHAFTDTSYTTLLWTVLLASKDTKLKNIPQLQHLYLVALSLSILDVRKDMVLLTLR